MKATFKKTVLGVAVAAAMGVSASASADTIDMNFTGLFTMLTSTGAALANTSQASTDSSWAYGLRTAITGTFTMNTTTGAGSGTVVPFAFYNGGNAAAAGITMQAIGNGVGGPGSLVLGNMLFNWNGNNGIPVSIVLDAQGMFGAMQQPGFNVGSVINGAYGVLGASDGVKAGKIKMGTLAVATTGWNTSTVAGAGMGTAVSGALPLIANSIGGSPMIAGPFTGFNANFDIQTLTVTSITPDAPAAVPVPAAAWLLGSGLLGLVGVARRKAA